MIALTILALVAITVYSQTAQALEQTARVEQRLLAAWMARNQLVTLRLDGARGVIPAPGATTNYLLGGGREWRIEQLLEDTADPHVRRVTVRVRLDDDPSEYVLAELQGAVWIAVEAAQ